MKKKVQTLFCVREAPRPKPSGSWGALPPDPGPFELNSPSQLVSISESSLQKSEPEGLGRGASLTQNNV